MKWLIIGIAGPTCSGKTSIAKKIQESIEDSILINQDKYFLHKTDSNHILIPELNHFNWEILSSLDMTKMYNDMLKIINSIEENSSNNKLRILIVEGILIYNYKPIADLFHKKYFIDISRELCWERRKNRVYDPPDVPGYFDKIVWPEYLRYKSELISNQEFYKTIKFLDGCKSLNKLHSDIMEEINTFVSNHNK